MYAHVVIGLLLVSVTTTETAAGEGEEETGGKEEAKGELFVISLHEVSSGAFLLYRLYRIYT